MARSTKSPPISEETPVAAGSPRKGGAHRADVPDTIRKQLNAGTLEAVTLVEVLVVDFAKLMRAVVPDLPAQQLKRLDPDWASPSAWRWRANCCSTRRPFRVRHLPQTPFRHGSRMGPPTLLGRTPELSLEERLRRVRPLADDPNSGVREWAWISLRPHVSREIERAIPLLRPWIAERTNIRRFAVEITRRAAVVVRAHRAVEGITRTWPAALDPLVRERRRVRPGFRRELAQRRRQIASRLGARSVCGLVRPLGGPGDEAHREAGAAELDLSHPPGELPIVTTRKDSRFVTGSGFRDRWREA